MADIEVTNNEAESRFEVTLGGETAFAEYRLVDHGIILPHTVVPTAFEGRGIASKLAVAAFTYARENDRKVIPTCPFMAGWVKKHPEWRDIVHDTYRTRLELG
ncbi:GNAT family N-acetyltransferase [Phenylobacterium sp.]|uniref:GNAT family N-acetyltransferase n=1 Tax=Phenylobacterium sp. TaxID=1871053 RepID=UPI00301BB0CA